jgi:hypothetical protein
MIPFILASNGNDSESGKKSRLSFQVDLPPRSKAHLFPLQAKHGTCRRQLICSRDERLLKGPLKLVSTAYTPPDIMADIKAFSTGICINGFINCRVEYQKKRTF